MLQVHEGSQAFLLKLRKPLSYKVANILKYVLGTELNHTAVSLGKYLQNKSYLFKHLITSHEGMINNS